MRYQRNARVYQPQPLEMFLKEGGIELIRARGIIDEEVRGLFEGVWRDHFPQPKETQ